MSQGLAATPVHKKQNTEDQQYHEEIILADHGILLFVSLTLVRYSLEPSLDVIAATLAGDGDHKQA